MSNTRPLLSAALSARKKAYAPYSGFAVGCALLADDKQIYTGANVENISYPCGTCAEAGAIAAMIAGSGRRILEILITAGGMDALRMAAEALIDPTDLITPCGACLQRIAEFADAETQIHLADTTAVKKTLKLADLLPLGFKERSLKS